MRDPQPKARARLTRVRVHASVFERIRTGPDNYAPIVLPAEYEVVEGEAAETAQQAEARVAGQVAVWNDVWRRRVNYFATVAASVALAVLPFTGMGYLARACEGPQCLLSPALYAIGAFLPAVAQPWIETYARNPATSVVLAGLLAWLLLRGASLQQRIQDRTWALWQPVHRRPAAAPAQPGGDGWVRALRTDPRYQRTLQILKWQAAPNLFGCALLLLLLALGAGILGLGVHRTRLAAAERRRDDLRPASGGAAGAGGPVLHRRPVLAQPHPGAAGRRIRNPADGGGALARRRHRHRPLGFASSRFTGWARLGLPLRRSLDGNWLQPFITIAPERGPRRSQALGLHFTGSDYVAVFRAPASGPRLSLDERRRDLPGAGRARGSTATTRAPPAWRSPPPPRRWRRSGSYPGGRPFFSLSPCGLELRSRSRLGEGKPHRWSICHPP